MADITLEQFEQQARAFLEANASRKEENKKFVWGEGSDTVAMFEERDKEAERDRKSTRLNSSHRT